MNLTRFCAFIPEFFNKSFNLLNLCLLIIECSFLQFHLFLAQLSTDGSIRDLEYNTQLDQFIGRARELTAVGVLVEYTGDDAEVMRRTSSHTSFRLVMPRSGRPNEALATPAPER